MARDGKMAIHHVIQEEQRMWKLADITNIVLNRLVIKLPAACLIHILA
jgi:hypothetical protein